MREVIIRIPGQKKDLVLNELDESLTVGELKEIIETQHEDHPLKEQQRLIHSGKLLDNTQSLTALNLSTENNGSQVIHLVVSRAPPPPTPTPPPQPAPPVQEVPIAPPPEIQEVRPGTPNPTPAPQQQQQQQNNQQSSQQNDWQSADLVRYFKMWDLSIKCHQLSDKHRHLVPQLELYKSLILAKQKELATGTPETTVNQQDLPRRNIDRENAVMGAQGQMEEDIQGDWLDWFYTTIKVVLILMTLYNYNSTDSFLAIILCVVTFVLYQGGFFRLQRRRRQQNPANEPANPNPERPGIFRMLFIFITRFITSLVPNNPAPVNIN